MMIYSKTEGLITTGDRSVNNFQSGLIRVDQKYTGLSTNEASDRTLLADGLILPNQPDDPSIDGLYIYGGAQESRNGDGFTNFQVSAYGRRIDTMVELSRNQRTVVVRTSLTSTLNNVEVIIYDMIGTIVKKRGEIIEPNEFIFSDDFLMPKYVRYVRLPQVESISIAEINVNNFVIPTRTYQVRFNDGSNRKFKLKDPIIRVTSQRNFGKWIEYEFEAIRQSDSAE
jgi:hypothetical protein